MKILVTGGAGYIGSHVLLALANTEHEMIVYDNLSTGHAWAVHYGQLVVGHLEDREKLEQLFAEHRFEAVIHFAASIVVSESVTNPVKYYANNSCNTLCLLELCVKYDVKHFIFSSTAAVYGEPECVPVKETTPLQPCNPYGASKMMSERMIQDIAKASSLDYVILRYFNAAGADPMGRSGQSTPNATHLIKATCDAASGTGSGITVFGSDYPTHDGTCIRDYIHVSDLAIAHTLALDYLNLGGESCVLNCGYGTGHSVLEVIDTMKIIAGVDFPVHKGNRRLGDAQEVVADGSRIRNVLGWMPKFDSLSTIIETAWHWHQKQRKVGSQKVASDK